MRKYLIPVVVFALILGGFVWFSGDDSSENPPMLSWNPQLYQGMLEGGKQGFLEFDDEDEDGYKDFIKDYQDEHDDAELMRLHEGVNYVYAPRDVSVDELRQCIDPEAQMVLFAQYNAEEEAFMVYPEGPFKETEEVDADYVFEAGRGLVIIAKHSADSYCVAGADEKSDVEIVEPIDADVDGWVLLAANRASVEDVIEPFKDRVKRVWMMVDDTEFEKVKVEDYDEGFEDFYLVWLKLDKVDNEEDEAASNDNTAVQGDQDAQDAQDVDSPDSQEDQAVSPVDDVDPADSAEPVSSNVPANVRATLENSVDGKTISVRWDQLQGVDVKNYLVQYYYYYSDGENGEVRSDVVMMPVSKDSRGYGIVRVQGEFERTYKISVAANLNDPAQQANPQFSEEVIVVVPAGEGVVEEGDGGAEVEADEGVANAGGEPVEMVITAVSEDVDDMKEIFGAVDEKTSLDEGRISDCLQNLPCVVVANSYAAATELIAAIEKQNGAADYSADIYVTSFDGANMSTLFDIVASMKGISSNDAAALLSNPLPVLVAENMPMSRAEWFVALIERRSSAQASVVMSEIGERGVVYNYGDEGGADGGVGFVDLGIGFVDFDFNFVDPNFTNWSHDFYGDKVRFGWDYVAGREYDVRFKLGSGEWVTLASDPSNSGDGQRTTRTYVDIPVGENTHLVEVGVRVRGSEMWAVDGWIDVPQNFSHENFVENGTDSGKLRYSWDSFDLENAFYVFAVKSLEDGVWREYPISANEYLVQKQNGVTFWAKVKAKYGYAGQTYESAWSELDRYFAPVAGFNFYYTEGVGTTFTWENVVLSDRMRVSYVIEYCTGRAGCTPDQRVSNINANVYSVAANVTEARIIAEYTLLGGQVYRSESWTVAN